MNFFHLIILFVSFFTFSGTPLPNVPVVNASAEVGYKLNIAEDDEHIPWTYSRRLSWDDFLCDPQLGTDAVASTSTSLGIAYQIKNWKLTYEITCKFSKTRSWGLLKTPYILAHEQAHFDITELYARKLHQALQQYTLNRYTFKKDIGEIYQRIVDEKEAFQAAYDGETDHSRNRRVQVEWLDKIELLLIETEPYADYP